MAKAKKKKMLKQHFENSCLKRVGVVLDDKEIINLVQKNKLSLIDRQSNNITRWKYTFEEKDYMVVYNKNQKQVVTIIPYKEGMENNTHNDFYWWILQKETS